MPLCTKELSTESLLLYNLNVAEESKPEAEKSSQFSKFGLDDDDDDDVVCYFLMINDDEMLFHK